MAPLNVAKSMTGTVPANPDSSAARSPVAGQRYAQVPVRRPNFNSPPTPNILQSFVVQQNRDQITIVDADGSIYEGRLSNVLEEGIRRSRPPVTSDSERPTSAATYAVPTLGSGASPSTATAAPLQRAQFYVIGTNRTLNQRVTFSGELIPALAVADGSSAVGPRQPPPSRYRATTSPERSPAPSAPGSVVPPNIQGQAAVGYDTRLTIRAIPVQPLSP
jgi:hypothetical protein